MSNNVGSIQSTNNINTTSTNNGTIGQTEAEEIVLNGNNSTVGDEFTKSRKIKWNKPSFKKTKKKLAGESDDAANFRHTVYTMRYDVKPAELRKLVESQFTDDREKASVLAFIDKLDKVTDPEMFKKMYKKADNDVEKSILAVYIGNAQETANTKLLASLTNDKTTNFTTKLEHLKKGIYYDKDGNEVKGKKFPENSYDKEALKEILPILMEAKVAAIVEKLQEEGALKDIKSDKQLEKLIINKAESVDGKDVKFREFVKSDPEIILRARREATVLQRREELTHVSLGEIESELSPETCKSIQQYMNNHRNGDGTYDLSALSEAVEYRVSKEDYLVNRSTEIETAWRGFVAGEVDEDGNKEYYVNLADFDKPSGSRTQTKELIKFCRFPIEEKDHSWRVGREAAVGGASGAAAAATVFTQVRVSLEELGTFIGSSPEVSYRVIIDATIGSALLPVGVGIAAGIITDKLIGRTPQERDCFNQLDFDINNPMYYKKDNYVQYLKDIGEYDKVKDELEQYPKWATPGADGRDWDHESCRNARMVSGGTGSLNNCREGVSVNGGKKVTDGGEIYTTEKSEADISQDQVKNEDDIIFKKQAKRSSWAHLTTLYDCGEKSLVEICGGNVNKAIRIIKIAQAVTDGNYSYERLNELYKLSIQGPQYLQNIEGIDYDVYYDVWANNFPPAVKLPTNLAGAERCEISEDEHELRLGYKLDPSQIANTQAAKGPANGTIIISSIVTKGGVKYGVFVPGQQPQWFDKVTDRDAVVSKIIKEHPKYNLNSVDPNRFDEIVKKSQM